MKTTLKLSLLISILTISASKAAVCEFRCSHKHGGYIIDTICLDCKNCTEEYLNKNRGYSQMVDCDGREDINMLSCEALPCPKK